ncbi:MAG: hypothetical protein IKM05_06525 [Clostridia bacterium]|nr:hypothetical protein [Clostridia bacterium]
MAVKDFIGFFSSFSKIKVCLFAEDEQTHCIRGTTSIGAERAHLNADNGSYRSALGKIAWAFGSAAAAHFLSCRASTIPGSLQERLQNTFCFTALFNYKKVYRHFPLLSRQKTLILFPCHAKIILQKTGNAARKMVFAAFYDCNRLKGGVPDEKPDEPYSLHGLCPDSAHPVRSPRRPGLQLL